ncbi:MAG: hypothetical protein Q9164_006130 [Protoblastenia rupestris]
MSDSVDRVFVHALNTVKRIPRTGSARPPETDRLKLYGLYKQSMEGDVERVMRKPQGDNKDEISEREKWEAWNSHAGLSRTEAKRQYISTLIETMHRYATTTPEARELVAELEFVWDQIKTNSASSSASSPDQKARSQALQQASVSGYGISRAQRTEGDGLQLLRPLSEEDEGEEHDPDEIDQTCPGAFEDDDAISAAIDRPLLSDLDVRNRKWRKRVEQALVKMTVEIAALREQIVARGLRDRRRRNGVWAWMIWFVWASMRHLLVDATLLAVLILWSRKTGNGRIERNLQMLLYWVKQRVGGLQIPRFVRISESH